MYILKIEKIYLLKLLNIINSIIDEKNLLLPILKNFLIKKKKNNINFLINNIDLQIKFKIKTNIKNDKKFFIGISVKNLLKIIKKFPNNFIIFKIFKKKLIIKCKNIKFILNIILANNYPLLKKKVYKINILIFKKDLLNLINLTYFIIDVSDVDNFINGILFIIKKNIIKIIVTDNYRIAFYNIKNYNKINNFKKIIIPSKTIFLLKKILENKKEIIKINFNKNQINFDFDNIKITSKLIDGNFPIFKDKIYKNYKKNFLIDRITLQSALNRSVTIIKENFNNVKWIINNNLLKIISKNKNEKGIEKLIIKYNNKNININLNTKHILDILKNVKFKNIQFNFPKNNKIVIVRIPEEKNLNYILTTVKI